MNVSASKLWNESNHTKLNSVKNALPLCANDVQFNQRKNE